MTEKITPVEQKIIEYLSAHRKQNTQEIQKAIGIEYITVHKAINRMKKSIMSLTLKQKVKDK
jgi:DNA-binding MarR family transcriptional regulator